MLEVKLITLLLFNVITCRIKNQKKVESLKKA